MPLKHKDQISDFQNPCWPQWDTSNSSWRTETVYPQSKLIIKTTISEFLCLCNYERRAMKAFTSTHIHEKHIKMNTKHTNMKWRGWGGLEAWRDESSRKGIYQAWTIWAQPWVLHDISNEAIVATYPLTSTCALWYVQTHAQNTDNFKKRRMRTEKQGFNKLAQWDKVLAMQPWDLSLIPGIYIKVEGGKWILQVVIYMCGWHSGHMLIIIRKRRQRKTQNIKKKIKNCTRELKYIKADVIELKSNY